SSDLALHGLEGLTREAFVGLAKAPSQRDHEARGDLGVLAEQPAHVWTEHAHDARRLDRFNRGRAALVLEQRQLAEDVASAEARERERAPVAVRADRAHASLAHHVTGAAGIALAKHHLASREAARHRQLGD